MTTVWMRSPAGEVKEVVATPEILVPLLVQGWSQCEAPAPKRKEKQTDGESA